MEHELSGQTSALVIAVGILVGECVFGMFGPPLLIPLLSWFEIDFPGAAAVGVLVGAGVGYVLADGVLHLYRHVVSAGMAPSGVVPVEQAGVHL